MKKKILKLGVAIIAIIFAAIIFNLNKVNAAIQTGTTKKANVELGNKIEDNLLDLNVDQGSWDENGIITYTDLNIFLELDGFKAYNLCKDTSKLSQITQNDGNVYQTVYIEIDNDINEVTVKENNKKLKIVEKNGKKYIEYNVKVFKKEKSGYSLYNENDEIVTLQYKKDSENIFEQETDFATIVTKNYYDAYLEAVDSNGKYIGSEIDTNYGKSNLGETCWSQIDLTRAADYTDAYYKLFLSVNTGDSINVDKLGEFKYSGIEYSNIYKKNMYIYKAKITDTSILNSSNKVSLVINVVDKTTNQGCYNYIDMCITGDKRQTYSVKKDNVGISVNASTGANSSLKVDDISKDNETYLEMTSGILNFKDYIQIACYNLSIENGKYEGNLTLTFDVGTENEGKTVYIWHRKADKTIEDFKRKVENGKVTITVTELSPFLLAYSKNDTIEENNKEDNIQKENNQENNNKVNEEKNTQSGEKDNTPKTGTKCINTIFIIIPLIIALAIIIKKRRA